MSSDNLTCACKGTTHDHDCWTCHPAKGVVSDLDDATTRNETDRSASTEQSDRTSKAVHNPSDTGIDVQPCDCGTVDCAKSALEYGYSARAHGEAPQDRNDADPDIGSPEMPAPGYDAQTRPMPVALAPGQYHHDREDRP